MGFQIALILFYFFQVNDLIIASKIFGTSVQEILPSTLFSLNPPDSYEKYFTLVYQVSWVTYLISIMASLAIMVLCLEILYLLSHNRDFQMLSTSMYYSISQLPYIFFVMSGFIISFTFMGHFILGAEYYEFSTFFQSLVQFTNYIFNINNMPIYREDGRFVEFFIMILPYILTVRFIIINIFLSITYRGYYLTKKKMQEEEEQKMQKEKSLDFTIKDFVLITFEMIKFKEQLPHSSSNLYIKEVIRQFNPAVVFSKIKENIRTQSDVVNMKTWAESCASDIKNESEVRMPMDLVCQEIVNDYLSLNNQGDFEILEKLNLEFDRKEIEYNLKLSYFEYFRTSTNQIEKFYSFFDFKISFYKENLYQNFSQFKKFSKKKKKKGKKTKI